MEAKRISVSTLLDAGWTKTAISNHLKFARSFVYKVAKLKYESGYLKRKPGSGRPKIINPTIIKNLLKRNPTKSMSAVAKDLGIHKTSVSKEV
ncbi:Uncharacterized protein FKW44_025372 [Caligus rogercresseyi]|uniref:Uncharacterized protein n=1 Tax=Caligus rogercresseyi TaxID=217165 RepID=A0A7T8JT44_CALRO|nr:Uncharacterized protein FKW44_025372 [Caligus rogercresseyi]